MERIIYENTKASSNNKDYIDTVIAGESIDDDADSEEDENTA